MKTIVILYYAAISLVTLAVFGHDKVAARRGWWRTRESTLLWLTGLGGFIGALLGMHIFRHKTTRPVFRILPWAAAVIHGVGWILVTRG